MGSRTKRAFFVWKVGTGSIGIMGDPNTYYHAQGPEDGDPEVPPYPGVVCSSSLYGG